MSTNPITIRRAQIEDAGPLAEAFRASVLSLGREVYDENQCAVWASSGREDRMASLILETEVFVAEMDRQVAGFASLNPATAELDMLYVRPDFTRRGVATALVERVEEAARGHDLAELSLRGSLNAAPFYRRVGYGDVVEFDYPHPSGNVTFRVLRMTKQLGKETG